jgi:hypothetical protein
VRLIRDGFGYVHKAGKPDPQSSEVLHTKKRRCEEAVVTREINAENARN